MESQPLWKGATMRMNPIRNNESSLEHCLCPVRHPVYSSVLKIVTMYPPPPNPYISETAFSQDFKKHTHPPPPQVTTFWCIRPKFDNKTLPKCENLLRVGTFWMSQRDFDPPLRLRNAVILMFDLRSRCETANSYFGWGALVAPPKDS